MAQKLKLVVLISGSGSNLQSIIDAINDNRLDASIAAVISNVSGAKGLKRANNYNIPCHVLCHKDYSDRQQFDDALQILIDSYDPELIILAGFMRILGEKISRHYRGMMLNIHPSLLPNYPGLHTHQKVLDNNETHHGTTIHYVTEELDGGPVVYQCSFPIQQDDTVESLFEKVQALEHEMYPRVIQWVAEHRLQFTCDGPKFDGRLLELSGINS